MAPRPKYLALPASKTGLPWATGIVHTQKCRCFATNKSMFRRCEDCGHVQCAKCFNRDGWKHRCSRPQNLTGPFPTWEQERQVVAIFGGEIPPRDDPNRPERATDNGTWIWTPTSEALNAAPGVRMTNGNIVVPQAPVAMTPAAATQAIAPPTMAQLSGAPSTVTPSTVTTSTAFAPRLTGSVLTAHISGWTAINANTAPLNPSQAISTPVTQAQPTNVPTASPYSLGILNFSNKNIKKPQVKKSLVVVLRFTPGTDQTKKQVKQGDSTATVDNGESQADVPDTSEDVEIAAAIEESLRELSRSTRNHPRAPPRSQMPPGVEPEDYIDEDMPLFEEPERRKRKRTSGDGKPRKHKVTQAALDEAQDEQNGEDQDEDTAMPDADGNAKEPETKAEKEAKKAAQKELSRWKKPSATKQARSRPFPMYPIGNSLHAEQDTSRRRSIRLDVSSIQILNLSLAPGATYLSTTNDANSSNFYLSGSYDGGWTTDIKAIESTPLFILRPADDSPSDAGNIHLNVSTTDILNLSLAPGVSYLSAVTNPLSTAFHLVASFNGSPMELIAASSLFVLEPAANFDADSNIPPIPLPLTQSDNRDRLTIPHIARRAPKPITKYFSRVYDTELEKEELPQDQEQV